jgi:hypothetical protein
MGTENEKPEGVEPEGDALTEIPADEGETPELELEEETPDEKPAEGEEPGEKPDTSGVSKILGSDQPVWLQELLAELEREGREAHEITDEEIAALPVGAQKLVANLVARSRAAEQALVERQTKAAEREAELAKKQRQVQRERGAAFGWGKKEQIAKFVERLERKGERDLDPFTEEGVQQRVERTAAKLFQSFFQQLGELEQSEKAAADEAEAEATRTTQLAELQAYAKANPSFSDPEVYSGIKDLVTRSNYQISAQEAHKLVLARLATEREADLEAKALEAARRKVRPGRSHDNTPLTPKFERADDEVEFYEKNPKALQRDYEAALAKRPGY